MIPARRDVLVELWQATIPVRDAWLAAGLCTEPADRDSAEAALTRIYARHRRPRPAFVWADSPAQAQPLVTGLPDHDELRRWTRPRWPQGRPPLASDLAAGLSRLRLALDDSASFPPPAVKLDPKKYGTWPPEEALARGMPLRLVLLQDIYGILRKSLFDGFCAPVRAALGPSPVSWYGQQEAPWIAYYDALTRLGLARYEGATADHFADWRTLARTCGWWWPADDVCVVAERPAALIRYRDGWTVTS